MIETIYRYWRGIVMALGVGLLVLGATVVFKQDAPEIEIIPAPEKQPSGEKLIVDIEGAVIKPGIYQLPPESRLNDLLIACGGLDQEADRDWVAKNLNLALPLLDGAKIYVPEAGEILGNLQTDRKVNLNNAQASELETLPGIGPSFAQKIIEYRQKNNGFKSVEEIMAVSGIGQKTFERIKDKITIY